MKLNVMDTDKSAVDNDGTRSKTFNLKTTPSKNLGGVINLNHIKMVKMEELKESKKAALSSLLKGNKQGLANNEALKKEESQKANDSFLKSLERVETISVEIIEPPRVEKVFRKKELTKKTTQYNKHIYYESSVEDWDLGDCFDFGNGDDEELFSTRLECDICQSSCPPDSTEIEKSIMKRKKKEKIFQVPGQLEIIKPCFCDRLCHRKCSKYLIIKQNSVSCLRCNSTFLISFMSVGLIPSTLTIIRKVFLIIGLLIPFFALFGLFVLGVFCNPVISYVSGAIIFVSFCSLIIFFFVWKQKKIKSFNNFEILCRFNETQKVKKKHLDKFRSFLESNCTSEELLKLVDDYFDAIAKMKKIEESKHLRRIRTTTFDFMNLQNTFKLPGMGEDDVKVYQQNLEYWGLSNDALIRKENIKIPMIQEGNGSFVDEFAQESIVLSASSKSLKSPIGKSPQVSHREREENKEDQPKQNQELDLMKVNGETHRPIVQNPNELPLINIIGPEDERKRKGAGKNEEETLKIKNGDSNQPEKAKSDQNERIEGLEHKAREFEKEKEKKVSEEGEEPLGEDNLDQRVNKHIFPKPKNIKDLQDKK